MIFLLYTYFGSNSRCLDKIMMKNSKQDFDRLTSFVISNLVRSMVSLSIFKLKINRNCILYL